MTDPFVVKGGFRFGLSQVCAYSPTGSEADDCGRPATWHVLWDAELDNGLACDEHMALIERRLVFADRHRVVADCDMPGARWSFRDERCFVPGSGDVEAAEALTEAVAS